MILRPVIVILCCIAFATFGSAQEGETTINKSLIPIQASGVGKFVPRGWKIEKRLEADLNGDSLPDFTLELVENKPEKDQSGDPTERFRALVIVLRNQDGQFTRAGVAAKLLQCTRCGGAFYGVVESPANVKIEKGVIVVQQDHGSRDLTNTTYRFRYDADSQRFVLIGFDFADADRLTGNDVSESTNYLTGVRKVSRGKAVTSSTIPHTKIFLDDVDYEKFEEDADTRLISESKLKFDLPSLASFSQRPKRSFHSPITRISKS